MQPDALRQALNRAQDHGAVRLEDQRVIVAPWLYQTHSVTAP